MAVFLYQADDGHGVYGRIGAEGDGDDCGRGFYLEHAIWLAQYAQAVYGDERFGLCGQFAKAVYQLFKQLIDLLVGFGSGEFFIEAQAHVHVATVVIRQ